MPDPNVDPNHPAAPVQPVAPQPPGPTVLDGPDIPESFRGKSAKEVVDTLLVTSTQVEEMKSKLTKLEQEKAQLEQFRMSQPAPQPPVQESEDDKKARMEQEFFRKPVDYLEKHFQNRLQPLTQEFFRTQEGIQKTLARQRLDDFEKYEKKIDQIMQQTPPELRSRPESWDIAYNLALGEEYRSKLKESKAKGGLFSETKATPAPTEPSKVELTDAQKTVAKRFGLTDDEYASQLADMDKPAF